MNVLLLHLDGRLPNLALMRLAHHYRSLGDDVQIRRAGNLAALEPRFEDLAFDVVCASAIFEWSQPLCRRVLEIYPHATIGGTGWDISLSLDRLGISDAIDYTDYPKWRHSIGFTQRGCRLKCGFCVVPKKEGGIRAVGTIADIWRGEPWPREIVLLDNDFFGNPDWRARIDEMRSGNFRICFSQGINARALDDETAAAIASVDYRGLNMRERRIYTAWDSIGHERPLFRGLEALVKHGVKPDQIMVYMLIGYGDSAIDREQRRRKLREFGCRPYPMPYRHTPELRGFQRWVIGAYDKRVSWAEWTGARFSPRRLGDRVSLPLFRDGAA